MVDPVTRPDMMGDRPARDHHHADDHLHVLRLAVAAVAVLGEIVRAGALEVGTGDVVEHQVGLEAEEVAETVVERHFDLVLGRVELIEGAVPGVELAGMDTDPPALVPVGDEASALAIADEVGLEPAGEPVLTGGGDGPVGDEHEGGVGDAEPGGANKTRTKRTGPQFEASPTWGSAGSATSPARRRRSLGRTSTRRSLRPRSATTRCLTLPPSR